MRACAGASRALVNINALLLVVMIDDVAMEAAADVSTIRQIRTNMIAASAIGVSACARMMASQLIRLIAAIV